MRVALSGRVAAHYDPTSALTLGTELVDALCPPNETSLMAFVCCAMPMDATCRSSMASVPPMLEIQTIGKRSTTSTQGNQSLPQVK